MYQITTQASFDAAHFLSGYQGKCGNIHGHRWKVVATLQSENLREDQQQRGMCVDFSMIKEELNALVDDFDHTFILEQNSLKTTTIDALVDEGFALSFVPFRPTAEQFAKYFYDKLQEKGYRVELVQVYETPNNCAGYSGNGDGNGEI